MSFFGPRVGFAPPPHCGRFIWGDGPCTARRTNWRLRLVEFLSEIVSLCRCENCIISPVRTATEKRNRLPFCCFQAEGDPVQIVVVDAREAKPLQQT